MEYLKDKAPAILLCSGIVLLLLSRVIDSCTLTAISLGIILFAYAFDSIFNHGFMGDP